MLQAHNKVQQELPMTHRCSSSLPNNADQHSTTLHWAGMNTG
jgi:hypothetical protein